MILLFPPESSAALTIDFALASIPALVFKNVITICTRAGFRSLQTFSVYPGWDKRPLINEFANLLYQYSFVFICGFETSYMFEFMDNVHVQKDAYKKIAGSYDIFVEPLVKSLRAASIKMIPVGKGMKVLDVGCGTGTYLKLLQKNGYIPFGIDPSFAMMAIARAKLGENVRLRLGDASKMSCPDDTFDLVTFFMVLHEMPAVMRSAVFSEAKRVMKKNGRILIVDYLPGPNRSVKGWFLKVVIIFYEIAAGWEHFRNYQNFLACRGLYTLIKENRLSIKKKKIATGGNIGSFVIK